MTLRNLIAPPLKSVLRTLAPGFAAEWQSRREDRHGQRVMRDSGVFELTERFLRTKGRQVQSGPFSGMLLECSSVGSALLPKLIGSYESELHEFIASCLRIAHESIVDVGAAEGFYAVGLAKFGSGGCPIHAFDLNLRARDLCRSLAELNGVSDRVEVGGACHATRLGELLDAKRGFVISDCEGFESQLFTTFNVTQLSRCDILIELHEGRCPGVTDALMQLLSASHDLQLIPAADRSADDFPALDGFSEQERRIALSEFRGETQNWLLGTPNFAQRRDV